jgi:putative RNA 2'-phosphotransferase
MIPYEFSAERLSRWMAYVLRHNPDRYGLQPDRHGAVDVEEFLNIARRRYPDLTLEQLQEFLVAEGSGRFELASGRLRARYGHSIPIEPSGAPVEPPPQLYHGTDQSQVAGLLVEGLSPRDRRMVHLSETSEEALTIARRKTQTPALIRIQAQAAFRSGVPFYRESNLYLAPRIPAEFLSEEPLPETATQL